MCRLMSTTGYLHYEPFIENENENDVLVCPIGIAVTLTDMS